MIEFRCPCGFVSKARDELAGRKVRCPKCGRIGAVAKPVAEPVAVVAESKPAPEVARVACPACAELILPGARKCPFCQEAIKVTRSGQRIAFSPAWAFIALFCILTALGSFGAC